MSTRSPRRHRIGPGRVGAWLLFGVAMLLTIAPFYWMLRTALTPAAELHTDHSGLFPENPTLVNFARVLGLVSVAEAQAAGGTGAQIDFLLYSLNSFVYAGTVAVGQTFFCAMAAYAFARLRFPGRDVLFAIVLGALMIPPIFTILPNFVLMKNLDLLGTLSAVIAPSVLMTPFAVFFLRQFFLSTPRDVEEAAVIDGAGRWGVFWRVVLPMNRAPLATIGLITAITAWKDFLWPLLAGREESARTLTVGLGVFLAQAPTDRTDWTGLMAASTLSVVPIIVLVTFLGRRLVQSLNFTGIK